MPANETAPIALFVYNRQDHTRRTIEALKQNILAEHSDIYIFSDAPKSNAQVSAVSGVRSYIHEIDGFKSVTIVLREANFGLARSIIDGVTTIVNKYGRIIVLEDDMATSPYFLTYMNEALEKYEDDDRVAGVHGWMIPVNNPLPEAFFLPGADCWGWATWSRGWACFNSDGQFLLDELIRRNLIYVFDYNGSYPYSKMLKDQINGDNDSWAVRWYASAFLAGKLTLHPGRSLVHNTGIDNSGTHCGVSAGYDVQLSDIPINLNDIEVQPSLIARQEMERFFKEQQAGLFGKLKRKLQRLIASFAR